jgi:hypothetical protein
MGKYPILDEDAKAAWAPLKAYQDGNPEEDQFIPSQAGEGLTFNHSRLVREGHVLDAIHTAARESGRPLRNDGWAAVGRRSSAEQAKLYRRATEILGLADAPRGGV